MKHIKASHSKSKPYICKICGHQSARKIMIQLHAQQHKIYSKSKYYNCQMCGYQSASKTMIKLHVRQHNGEKYFNCDKCEYKTGDLNLLNMTSLPPPNSLGLPPPPSSHLHLAELGDPAPPSHPLATPFKHASPDHSQSAISTNEEKKTSNEESFDEQAQRKLATKAVLTYQRKIKPDKSNKIRTDNYNLRFIAAETDDNLMNDHKAANVVSKTQSTAISKIAKSGPVNATLLATLPATLLATLLGYPDIEVDENTGKDDPENLRVANNAFPEDMEVDQNVLVINQQEFKVKPMPEQKRETAFPEGMEVDENVTILANPQQVIEKYTISTHGTDTQAIYYKSKYYICKIYRHQLAWEFIPHDSTIPAAVQLHLTCSSEIIPDLDPTILCCSCLLHEIGKTVSPHFFIKYLPITFFYIPLKDNLFIHQTSLFIHIFFLITSPSSHNLVELGIKPRIVSILDPALPYIHHIGTTSSPNNLHSHAPPLSHARSCEENKIFLTLRTLILKFPAIKIVITFDMVTSFTPSPIIQSYSKRQDKFLDQSSCFLEVKIEKSSIQATLTVCLTSSLYSGTLIVQYTQELYIEGALTQHTVHNTKELQNLEPNKIL